MKLRFVDFPSFVESVILKVKRNSTETNMNFSHLQRQIFETVMSK